MNQNNSNIDQQLQEKFSNFAPAPPAFAWDELNSKLEAKGKRKRGLIVWTVAASLTVAAVSGLMLLINHSDSAQTSVLKTAVNTQTESNIQPEVNVPQENKNNTSALPQFGENKEHSSQGHVKMNQDQVQELAPEVVENQETTVAETSSIFANAAYGDFGSKTPQIHPFHFGDFLQLTLITPSSRKPLERKLSRWAFEVGYDQNQTSVLYKSNPQLAQYVHKNYLQRMKESEFALSASQVHFALRYQLSNKWILSAGLSWMQNRTQQNFHFRDSMPASVQQGFEADALGNYPIFGYLSLGPQINYEGISNISMLSVPVGAIYERAINRKWTLTAEALVQANYLSAKKGNTLNYHNLMLQDIDGGVFRDLLWSGKFGVGIQRELSRKNSIGMRVNTQGMFTPMYKQNAAIENRGWSIGLSGYYVWRFIQ